MQKEWIFIAGPYLKLASVVEYEKQIYKILELQEGNIEVKKEFICKSNAKTKALVIYVLEDKAKDLDYKLYSVENKHLKYVLFKLIPLGYRIGSIQMNE